MKATIEVIRKLKMGDGKEFMKGSGISLKYKMSEGVNSIIGSIVDFDAEKLILDNLEQSSIPISFDGKLIVKYSDIVSCAYVYTD